MHDVRGPSLGRLNHKRHKANLIRNGRTIHFVVDRIVASHAEMDLFHQRAIRFNQVKLNLCRRAAPSEFRFAHESVHGCDKECAGSEALALSTIIHFK